jgi:hypothetical protein
VNDGVFLFSGTWKPLDLRDNHFNTAMLHWILHSVSLRSLHYKSPPLRTQVFYNTASNLRNTAVVTLNIAFPFIHFLRFFLHSFLNRIEPYFALPLRTKNTSECKQIRLLEPNPHVVHCVHVCSLEMQSLFRLRALSGADGVSEIVEISVSDKVIYYLLLLEWNTSPRVV